MINIRCLISGINGFVGQYLSAYLQIKNFSVYGFDIIKNSSNKQEHIFEISLFDEKRLHEIVTKIKPDFVFHLAGFSSVKRSFSQSELTKIINVNGTKNLLEAIIQAQINPRILIVSSAEIYGVPHYTPIDERHPLNPNSPYAESRLEQEKLCEKYDLDIIVSRSFNHTGPKRPPIFVCSDFAKQIAEIEIKKNAPVISVGNLEVKRDFTDVRDMVKAYLLALEKCKKGEIYNICSGNSYKIQTILETLLSLSKTKIKIKQDLKKMRPNDIPILQGDYTKFKKATSWNPIIPIERTLEDILENWREEFR